MPVVINSIISLVNFRRISQIEFFKQNPIEVQKEMLFSLLKKASNTDIGRKYDFNTILSVKTFQERVPVQDYEGLKPFVERLRAGEKNLLWPGEVKWFAKSSGPPHPKASLSPLPKTRWRIAILGAEKDVGAIFNKNYPENNIFSGKCLTLGGSHQINNFSNDSYFGDLSAILIENLPF